MPMPQTLWAKQLISRAPFTFSVHACRQEKRPYLENLDEKEDFGVLEVDGPCARNARDDGVDEHLSGQRIVIAHSEFDLVLRIH